MIPAKYTVVLKTIMDDEKLRPMLNKAMSTYPLYEKKSKEKYIPSVVPTRDVLNHKILSYYKYREIGFETIGRFLDELEIALNEIMPYYNQLFFSIDQDYDILYNVDYEKTIITDRDGTSSNKTVGSESVESSSETSSETTSNTNTTTNTNASDETETEANINNNNKHVKSSTPQGNIDVAGMSLNDVTHADEISLNNDSNTDNGKTSGESHTSGETHSEGTGSVSNTSSSDSKSDSSIDSNGTTSMKESITERTFGNYGAMSTQRQVQEYRDIILNIEQQIINDERISELFMRVY